MVFLLGLGLLAVVLLLTWLRRERQAATPPILRVTRLSTRCAARLLDRADPSGFSPLGQRQAGVRFRFGEEQPPPTGSDASTFKTQAQGGPGDPGRDQPGPVLTDEGLSTRSCWPSGSSHRSRRRRTTTSRQEGPIGPLPTVIEGRLPKDDHDIFRFRGKKGQRIVARLETAELGRGSIPTRSTSSASTAVSGRVSRT